MPEAPYYAFLRIREERHARLRARPARAAAPAGIHRDHARETANAAAIREADAAIDAQEREQRRRAAIAIAIQARQH